MATTLAGTPSLSRRKSIKRYRRLWPPPRKRRVIRPVAFRPPEDDFPRTKERSGRLLVISSKFCPIICRRPGVIGLYFLTGMAAPPPPPQASRALEPYRPSMMGIRSPSRRVTTAFFHSGVRPSVRPRRRTFPGTLLVFTFTTLTLKICSMACLICVLVARRSTSKVYWLASMAPVVFSVTTGRLMTSCGSIGPEHLLHLLHRILGDDDAGAVQHLVGVQAGRDHGAHTRQVPGRPPQLWIGLGGDQQGLPPCLEPLQHLGDHLRLVLRQLQSVHHQQLAVPQLGRKSTPERLPSGLLGHPQPPVPGLGPEDDATAPPEGRPDTPVPGPPQTLLPPGLPAPAPNLATGLGGRGPCPAVGQVDPHRLVHKGVVDGRAEDVVHPLSLAHHLAVHVVDVHLRHRPSSSLLGPARLSEHAPTP